MRRFSIAAAMAGVVGTLVAITVLGGSWYTVDQGERGVILRNGAYSYTAEPGLGFKMPIIDDVEYFSVQSKKRTYDGGEAAGFRGLPTYSKDQQPADVRISVNYRANPAKVSDLYARFGSVENAAAVLIDPKILEESKNVFGQFNAVTAVQERARLNNDIETAVRTAVADEPGIVIESVQIENIDFSQAYEDSIEARMLAEVEVQKLRQNAERERVQAEIVVIQAKADADKVRLQAEAAGDRARLIGEGEAAGIRAKGDALRENPLLVELSSIEKWNGVLPTTMPPGGTVPFISMGSGQSNVTPPAMNKTTASVN